MDQKKARQLLRTIDEGITFYCADGQTARNLEELSHCLDQMSEATYAHHVYFDHNDFSNWLLDCIGDNKLALDIFHASLHKAQALVRARLQYLEAHGTPQHILP